MVSVGLYPEDIYIFYFNIFLAVFHLLTFLPLFLLLPRLFLPLLLIPFFIIFRVDVPVAAIALYRLWPLHIFFSRFFQVQRLHLVHRVLYFESTLDRSSIFNNKMRSIISAEYWKLKCRTYDYTIMYTVTSTRLTFLLFYCFYSFISNTFRNICKSEHRIPDFAARVT